MRDVAIVILAAGGSSRFGSPKQLAMIDGKPMIRHAVDTARATGVTRIIVVLGNAAEEIAPLLHDVSFIVNDDWGAGLSTSIAKAIESVEDDFALLLLADQIAVTAADLHRLIAARDAHTIAAAEYSAKAGVPAIFPRTTFDALRSLQGDTGARTLLANAIRIPIPNAALDIDTLADLRNAGVPAG